jgi:hypothetical protein
MAHRPKSSSKSSSSVGVEDGRRTNAPLVNNPPAGMALLYEKLRSQYEKYTYDPRTDPHRYVQLPDGTMKPLSNLANEPDGSLIFHPTSLHAMFATGACVLDLDVNARTFRCPHNRQSSTTSEGTRCLKYARRIAVFSITPQYIRYLNDFPTTELTSIGVIRVINLHQREVHYG